MTIITPTGITGINSITSSGSTLVFQSASGTSPVVTGLDNISSSGIITATGFVGNITGNINATGVSTIATLSVTQSNPTNLNVSGISTFAAGSVSSPSISATGDSNTGIFFPAADTIAFAEGGVESARFDSNGRLGIGTAVPSTTLQIRGDGGGGAGTPGSYRGLIRIDNTKADPWAGISFPDNASAADSQSNNYYFIGRGASLSNRTLSVHIPNATDYGSGSQPIFGVFSTGSDKLFQVQSSTGNGYLKGSLGIGIESPSHKLSTYGTGAVRNEIVCTDNNAGGAGVYLRTLNSGTQVSNATLRTTNSGTLEVYTGTSSETIKLSIDTSGNLITPDNIGGGLSIGYKKVVTITGNFTANTWYNTGIDRTTDTGIYLLNAWVDTYNTGQSYQEVYIGWFVITNRSTNSGVADAITLHRNGHAPNAEVLQFRTLRTPGADSRTYLQWLSNTNLSLDGSAGRNIQVSIHRFATALNSG